MDLEICVEVLAPQNTICHSLRGGERWIILKQSNLIGNIVGLGRGEDWSAGES